MSATDEELRYVKDNEMDHVTYILIIFRFVTFFSLFRHRWSLCTSLLSSAFLLYTFIVILVNLYSNTGLNSSKTRLNVVNGSNIEMVTPSGRSKWYSRIPSRGAQTHILGDDDDDEDLMAPQVTLSRR